LNSFEFFWILLFNSFGLQFLDYPGIYPVSSPFFIIGIVAKKEKILPIRGNHRTVFIAFRIYRLPHVSQCSPSSITFPEAYIEIAISVIFGPVPARDNDIAFIRRDKQITLDVFGVDGWTEILWLAVRAVNKS
jgi:hypothetical protein